MSEKRLKDLPCTSFEYHSFAHYEKELFQNDLLKYDWDQFYASDCANQLWDIMESVILKFADLHCPLKKIVNQKGKPPWLNQSLLELIHERDRLYKIAKKSVNNTEDWANARKIRNLCNSCVKKAKENYVKEQLNNHNNDPKKFWIVIETVWNPNKKSNVHIHLVNTDTKEEIETENIPNYINEHLTNVAQKLTQTMLNCPFYETAPVVMENFTHTPVTVSQVDQLVKEIKIHKSSAIEGISSKILKDSLEVLQSQLMYIFNVSLATSVFPEKWKSANVVVLHKGGDRCDVNN